LKEKKKEKRKREPLQGREKKGKREMNPVGWLSLCIPFLPLLSRRADEYAGKEKKREKKKKNCTTPMI